MRVAIIADTHINSEDDACCVYQKPHAAMISILVGKISCSSE
jgi:hypothetical protein